MSAAAEKPAESRKVTPYKFLKVTLIIILIEKL
jgi:hypothetical protein